MIAIASLRTTETAAAHSRQPASTSSCSMQRSCTSRRGGESDADSSGGSGGVSRMVGEVGVSSQILRTSPSSDKTLNQIQLKSIQYLYYSIQLKLREKNIIFEKNPNSTLPPSLQIIKKGDHLSCSVLSRTLSIASTACSDSNDCSDTQRGKF